MASASAEPAPLQTERFRALEQRLLDCIAGKRSWDELRLIDLDPLKALRGAKKPRLLVIDEDELQCPVCLQHLGSGGGGIQTCKLGHAFCGDCVRVLTCPCCKVSLTQKGIKTIVHQKLISALVSECSLGCGSVMTGSQWDKHKFSCDMSKEQVCPFCSATDVCFKELGSHLSEVHKDKEGFFTSKLSDYNHDGTCDCGRWIALDPSQQDPSILLLLGTHINHETCKFVVTVSLWNQHSGAPKLDFVLRICSEKKSLVFGQCWAGRLLDVDWRNFKDGDRERHNISFPLPLREIKMSSERAADLVVELDIM